MAALFCCKKPPGASYAGRFRHYQGICNLLVNILEPSSDWVAII